MNCHDAHPPPSRPDCLTIPGAPPYVNITRGQNSAQYATKPSEDWTKISDLGERRRIQNRIAQRISRERKKLMRRLEDLERHPSSTSPPPSKDALLSQHDVRPRIKSNDSIVPKRSPSLDNRTFASLNPSDSLHARQDSRRASITPSPSLDYSAGFVSRSPSTLFQSQNLPQHPSHAQHWDPISEGPYAQPIVPPPAGLELSRLPSVSESWQSSKSACEDMFGMNAIHASGRSAAPYESGASVVAGHPVQNIFKPVDY